MRRVWQRASQLGYYFYASFLMPSRLSEYRHLLRSAVDAGYTFLTVEEYARRVRSGLALPASTFILRTDVDTDPETARLMFAANREYDVPSSFYFRLSTLDFRLMGEIASEGCEVSYHFEEIAAHAKRHGSRSAAEVLASLDEVQDRFRANLTWLRARAGLPMHVVASHGDFVNRALELTNNALLTASLRRELDIFAEVYDPDLRLPIDARISDGMPPAFWSGGEPLSAIRECSPVIYMLVHPRWWRVNVPANARDAVQRCSEGLSYALRRRLLRQRRRDHSRAASEDPACSDGPLLVEGCRERE